MVVNKLKTASGIRLKPRKQTINWLLVIMFVVLLVFTVIMLFILIWAAYNSLKTRLEYRVDVWALPKAFNLENFKKLLADGIRLPEFAEPISIGQLFLNSFLYAGGSALIGCLMRCFVAYVCAKFNYKVSRIIYAFVIVTMAMPIVGATASEISILRSIGLYDTFLGMYLLKAHFLGMHFLIFFAAFRSIPNTYIEAAKLDGASNFQVLFRVMLPLVRNIMLVSFLTQFIELWNDYSVPLLYLPSYPTLSRAIFSITVEGQAFNYTPIKLAGSMVLMIPMLLVYIAFAKKLMAGVSAGGIKE